MYSLPIAYLLWFFSGFGALGFHRFYLNKPGSALLFMFTGGLGMVGSVYDLITLPRQVRDANMKKKYKEALESAQLKGFHDGIRQVPGPGETTGPRKKKASIEKIILQTAKKHKGIATPAEVALEGDISIDKAKEYLETLVDKGFAEMRVRHSGTVVYVFQDFLDDDAETQFAD